MVHIDRQKFAGRRDDRRSRRLDSRSGLERGQTCRAAESAAKARPVCTPPWSRRGRDLRLDLFRGLALWLIFLDHIPSNIVSWVTIRNYGFSDATEIFIFISGYTAAFVYGKAMHERGFLIAGARILRRAWQIYVAHIFLFAIYMAEICLCRARASRTRSTPRK